MLKIVLGTLAIKGIEKFCTFCGDNFYAETLSIGFKARRPILLQLARKEGIENNFFGSLNLEHPSVERQTFSMREMDCLKKLFLQMDI